MNTNHPLRGKRESSIFVFVNESKTNRQEFVREILDAYKLTIRREYYAPNWQSPSIGMLYLYMIENGDDEGNMFDEICRKYQVGYFALGNNFDVDGNCCHYQVSFFEGKHHHYDSTDLESVLSDGLDDDSWEVQEILSHIGVANNDADS